MWWSCSAFHPSGESFLFLYLFLCWFRMKYQPVVFALWVITHLPNLWHFHRFCSLTTSTMTFFLFQGCQVLPTSAFALASSPFLQHLEDLLLFFNHFAWPSQRWRSAQISPFQKDLWDLAMHSAEFLYPTPNHYNFRCHCLKRPHLGLCLLRVTPLGFKLSSLLRYPQPYHRALFFFFIKC